ncbi:S9 family peptidase [soil metagenome]
MTGPDILAPAPTPSTTPTPTPTPTPYGAWPSPLDAAALTAASTRLQGVLADGTDLYWLEGRPAERGRVVLVLRDADGQATDAVGPDVNVRSAAHEYGGGAATVTDGVVVYSSFPDGRLFLVESGADPVAITPDEGPGTFRYADVQLDRPRRRLLAVREDHRSAGHGVAPLRTIVAIPLDGGPHEGHVLVDGHDFVMAPRLSPDGTRLCWITWEHPNMPWDASTLWVGDDEAGQARVVAGGPEESVVEASWLADGRLLWLADPTGWWNPYVDGRHVYDAEVEFGGPPWVFGLSSWVEMGDGRVAFRWVDEGEERFGLLDIGTGDMVNVPTDAVSIVSLVRTGDRLAAIAGFADSESGVVVMDLDGRNDVVRAASTSLLSATHISVAESHQWTAPDGDTAYGYFYEPVNPDVQRPDGERPPLIVLSHGGPTGRTSPAFSSEIQYWTTRGVAVLDVNYGGSSGYGRAYRQRLDGQWGVVDVDDCVSGAEHMVAEGRADGDRLVIRGGSAGGYTTLAALAFRDVFAAGVSLYGIGDLETMTCDTHKFESRYLDRLVGPYPADIGVYHERSPVHHVDGIDCALILLQGTDDKIVPPDQAVSMADAVRAKGRPVALVMFDGEGHGFRRADSIVGALESTLSFLGQVLGFTPAGDSEVLPIENL